MAWILLSNASVRSLEDGVLTLAFPRDGDLKGFSTSGCDADLKRVLSAGFGLNVTVKGVTGADPGAGSARPAAPAGPGPDQGPAAPGGGGDPAVPPGDSAPAVPPGGSAPARSRPRYEEPAPDEIPPDDMPSEEPDGDHAPVVTELTGMDLIQRELGGQVIGEIED